MYAASGFVDEATINEDCFGAVDYALVNDARIERLIQFIRAAGRTGWEYNALLSRRPLNFALVDEVVDPICGIGGILRGEGLCVENGFQCRFAPRILIFDNNIEGFVQFRGRFRFSVSGADPSALAGNHILLCGLGAIDSGLGLFTCCFSQLPVGFDHLIGLEARTFHLSQLTLHGRLLILHDLSLDAGVMIGNIDSEQADESSKPKA